MTALNQADKLYIGGALASAAYVGSNKVWPLFRPTDLSGCRIWLDASKLALADGAAVSAWTNLGSGPQPTIVGTPAPVFVTNAINTIMPCVRTTGTLGKFRFLATGVDKDYTLVYVGRKWTLTTGRVISVDAATANILIGFWGDRSECSYVEGWLTPDVVVPGTTQWRLYSGDATSTAGARLFSNGVLLRSGATTPAKGFGGGLNISGSGATECADCDIAELVMYNRRLTDAERFQVEQYLRAKWMAPWWSPPELGSRLVAWFDAANPYTVGLSGANVNNWFSSGGTAVASQSNATYMPPYNSAGVNFTLNTALVGQNLPASFDVIMVAKPNPFAAAPVDWRTMLRSAQGHEIIIESGSNRLGCYNAGFLVAGGLTWPSVEGMLYARIAPSTGVAMSRDGGAFATTAPLAAGSAAPTTGFGGLNGAPPTQGFGIVREVIFLPYNSSDAMRLVLEGYLAHKWGNTALLPAGHPYKNAPPLQGAPT
jgi:hypothetical protein